MGSAITLRWSGGGMDDVWMSQNAGITLGRIENITEKFNAKHAIHQLPTGDNDLIQRLGRANRTFSIKGILLRYNNASSMYDCRFFRDCIGRTGSISFSNAFSDSDILTGSRTSGFASTTCVLWTGIDYEDRAGRPMERRFILTAVEIR